MYKIVLRSFFIMLLFVNSMLAYAEDMAAQAPARSQAQQLYSALQQYPQNLSISWLNNLSNMLTQDDNSFSLIYAVCLQQTPCMQGPASFPIGSIGLLNVLQTVKPAVQVCTNSNNPYNCIQRKAGPAVVGMLTGDVGQLEFQLQAYLG